MYTYLNSKCGDVSLEYWGCAKTHFLEHIDKSKRFDKKGETYQFFLSDSRKFIVLQQIDSGFKLGIL